MEAFNSQASARTLLWVGFAGYRFLLGCWSRCLNAGNRLWWCLSAMHKWESLLIQRYHLIMAVLLLFYPQGLLLPGTWYPTTGTWDKQRQAHFKSVRQKFVGNILTWPERNPDSTHLGAAVVGMHLEGRTPSAPSPVLGSLLTCWAWPHRYPGEKRQVCLLLCVSPIVGCLRAAASGILHNSLCLRILGFLCICFVLFFSYCTRFRRAGKVA